MTRRGERDAYRMAADTSAPFTTAIPFEMLIRPSVVPCDGVPNPLGLPPPSANATGAAAAAAAAADPRVLTSEQLLQFRMLQSGAHTEATRAVAKAALDAMSALAQSRAKLKEMHAMLDRLAIAARSYSRQVFAGATTGPHQDMRRI